MPAEDASVLKQAGGKSCMIFESGKGCKLCYNVDWVAKFELTKGKKDFYSGCKGEVVETKVKCSKKKESLSCFKELNKQKAIDYTTYYDEKSKTFKLDVRDDDLKKFLKLDNSIKGLKVIPKDNPCVTEGSYSSGVIKKTLEKTGMVEIEFKPNK